MVGFVLFLSLCVAMGIAWFGMTTGYVLHTGGFERLFALPSSEFVLITAGLFCPIIVLAMGIAFVHLALEMRKIQLLFNIYVRKEPKKSKIPHDREEQRDVAILPISEKKEEPEPEPVILHDRPVLNISTQETVDKYRDISLPDNLDLHFVDKP